VRATAVSAHSGGSEFARAATHAAYEAAIGTGAEYAEIDIRRTRDGVLVVHHDPRVGPDGPLVGDLSYDQLCDCDDQLVPRAEDVMRTLGGKLAGHLDLKEAGMEEEVAEMALRHFGLGGFVVTTGDDASIARVKRAFPQVRAALSLGRQLAGVPMAQWAETCFGEMFPLARIRACGADWVAVNYRLARLGVLAQCARHGVGAMVWTVNSPRLIDRFLADQRVDVLITDRPGYAVRRRAELSRH